MSAYVYIVHAYSPISIAALSSSSAFPNKNTISDFVISCGVHPLINPDTDYSLSLN